MLSTELKNFGNDKRFPRKHKFLFQKGKLTGHSNAAGDSLPIKSGQGSELCNSLVEPGRVELLDCSHICILHHARTWIVDGIDLKGIVHNFFLYRSNLIFWIVIIIIMFI